MQKNQPEEQNITIYDLDKKLDLIKSPYSSTIFLKLGC